MDLFEKFVNMLYDDGSPHTLTINDDPATVAAFKAKESEINAKNYTIVPVHYEAPVQTQAMTLEEPIDEAMMVMGEDPTTEETTI